MPPSRISAEAWRYAGPMCIPRGGDVCVMLHSSHHCHWWGMSVYVLCYPLIWSSSPRERWGVWDYGRRERSWETLCQTAWHESLFLFEHRNHLISSFTLKSQTAHFDMYHFAFRAWNQLPASFFFPLFSSKPSKRISSIIIAVTIHYSQSFLF